MSFPTEFHWGVATSAYQVEGATAEGGRGRTDWDEFIDRPGTINRGDTAEIAADHYHRYAEDFDLLTELGVDTYRLSISWTRILPDGTGAVNQEGLQFYSTLIDELLARGITPFITLAHMELPLPLAENGGWLNRATADAFIEYATVVHEAFKDRVHHWTTLNEVSLTTWAGYGMTVFPPALDDKRLVLPAIHNQMIAHSHAVAKLRAAQPDGTFGIVGSYWPIWTLEEGADHQAAADKIDLLYNRSCVDVLVTGAYPAELLAWHEEIGGEDFIQEGDLVHAAGSMDFFGLNYYNPMYVAADPAGRGGPGMPTGIGIRQTEPDDVPRSAFGWPIVPEGFREVLNTIHDRYGIPVWITENGGAFDDYTAPGGAINDEDRISYLDTHLTAIEGAIEDGVTVLGYFAWSLIDNFEWAQGYSKRFGLVYVDFATQQRTPKASFGWYRSKVAAARTVQGELTAVV